MTRFHVYMQRTVIESTSCELEATSEEEAIQKANVMKESLEWTVIDTDYNEHPEISEV